jgi:hypothetical protein
MEAISYPDEDVSVKLVVAPERTAIEDALM